MYICPYSGLYMIYNIRILIRERARVIWVAAARVGADRNHLNALGSYLGSLSTYKSSITRGNNCVYEIASHSVYRLLFVQPSLKQIVSFICAMKIYAVFSIVLRYLIRFEVHSRYYNGRNYFRNLSIILPLVPNNSELLLNRTDDF